MSSLMKEADVPFTVETIAIRILVINFIVTFVSCVSGVFGAPTDCTVAGDFHRTSTPKGHVFP